MTPELINGFFALAGAIVGAGVAAFFSWIQYKKAQKRQEISETWLSHLSEIVAVEAQLGEIPEALRFHGLSKEDLDVVGITPREFSYLLNSFTLGGTWHRILHPDLKTPFGVDHYRYRMCKSKPTREAWPLVKKMMNRSPFVEQIDLTIEQIEREEAASAKDARTATSKPGTSAGDRTIKSWLGILMFGLLYPAVLGTFFYSLLPEVFAVIREPGGLDALHLIKIVISSLLTLHFIFDFYFTQQVALEASRYSGKAFFLDLLIVIALFVAYETTHLDDKGVEPEVRWVSGALCLSYVFFQIWERWMEPVIGENRLLKAYEISTAVVFFLVAAFIPRVGLLALVIFTSAVCMFFIARPIVVRVRKELQFAQTRPESEAEREGLYPGDAADT